MLALPWYAWLNLVGLLALWGLCVLAHKLQDSSGHVRAFNHATVVAAGFFVVAGAKGALANDPTIVTQGLAAFVIGATAWELLSAAYVMLSGRGAVAETAAPAAPEAEPVASDDGVLDLDEGTIYSTENQEKLAGAVSSVFAPGSSDGDRLRGLGTLLTLSDDEADADPGETTCNLFGIALTAATLGPPSYIALGVF